MLTSDDIETIRRQIRTMRRLSEVTYGYVTKRDSKRKLIWLKEYGEQPIPICGLAYEGIYHDDDGVDVTKRVVHFEPLTPQVGQLVVVARQHGERRLPKCLGVVLSQKGFPGMASRETTSATKVHDIMIQAGHDPGGHSDQPSGHEGETGAPGEVDFTIAVRDKMLIMFADDARFNAAKGTAWDASAGDGTGDILYNGDLFLSIHYDSISGQPSRYGFGWPTATEKRSKQLRDAIRGEYDKITGHPPYTPSFDQSTGGLTGYYSYSRLPNARAVLLIECGEGGPGGDDEVFLNNRRSEIARALYRGICIYYGHTPLK